MQASILEEDKKLRASDLSDELKKNQSELSIQEVSAREKLEKEVRWIQLKVFSLHLVFTLSFLPSYGGYVRYIVGIILTYFIGRYSLFDF